jgi:hypothetical protein
MFPKWELKHFYDTTEGNDWFTAPAPIAIFMAGISTSTSEEQDPLEYTSPAGTLWIFPSVYTAHNFDDASPRRGSGFVLTVDFRHETVIVTAAPWQNGTPSVSLRKERTQP